MLRIIIIDKLTRLEANKEKKKKEANKEPVVL